MPQAPERQYFTLTMPLDTGLIGVLRLGATQGASMCGSGHSRISFTAIQCAGMAANKVTAVHTGWEGILQL